MKELKIKASSAMFWSDGKTSKVHVTFECFPALTMPEIADKHTPNQKDCEGCAGNAKREALRKKIEKRILATLKEFSVTIDD